VAAISRATGAPSNRCLTERSVVMAALKFKGSTSAASLADSSLCFSLLPHAAYYLVVSEFLAAGRVNIKRVLKAPSSTFDSSRESIMIERTLPYIFRHAGVASVFVYSSPIIAEGYARAWLRLRVGPRPAKSLEKREEEGRGGWSTRAESSYTLHATGVAQVV
jgi:hypothetical protein